MLGLLHSAVGTESTGWRGRWILQRTCSSGSRKIWGQHCLISKLLQAMETAILAVPQVPS